MARDQKKQQVTVTVRSAGYRAKTLILERQEKRKISKEEREALKNERKHERPKQHVSYQVRALSEKLGIPHEEAKERIRKAKKVRIPKKKFKWVSSKKEKAVFKYGEVAIRAIVSGGGGPGTGKKK